MRVLFLGCGATNSTTICPHPVEHLKRGYTSSCFVMVPVPLVVERAAKIVFAIGAIWAADFSIGSALPSAALFQKI